MMADVNVKRKENVERILREWPDRIPIVVTPAPSSSVPQLDRSKFLVNKDITVGQFVYVVRKRITLSPDKALFFLVDGKFMPPNSATVGEMYAMHKRDDKLLVLQYCFESVFGACVQHGETFWQKMYDQPPRFHHAARRGIH